MIKPYIKLRNNQFECHRALLVGKGQTRQEAWDNMWALHYGKVMRTKISRTMHQVYPKYQPYYGG
jgi:hypothetical protein